MELHMVATVDGEQRNRRRHRTTKRKIIDGLLMVLGIPALLFTVLALSVELIEYRPSIEPANDASKATDLTSTRIQKERVVSRLELIAPIERSLIEDGSMRLE
jgi:hypothetical protein